LVFASRYTTRYTTSFVNNGDTVRGGKKILWEFDFFLIELVPFFSISLLIIRYKCVVYKYGICYKLCSSFQATFKLKKNYSDW
jgi:hypothetical protein